MIDSKLVVERFLFAQDRLVLQASDLSLETLSNMVSRQAIDLEPQYQRRDRWNASKQSELIESFVLNIPVPPIYLSEDDYGRYSVIDGKQRLTAIHTFMSGHLRLAKLEGFSELSGVRFAELPDELKNALSVRPYVRVVTLLKQTDPLLKYEVFTRLNNGGEPLSPQEIRNVAYRGPLNDLIYRLAGNQFLRRQLKITNKKSPAFRNMLDAEYVLRFLTMKGIWQQFSGSFSRSMDRFMLDHRNDKPSTFASYESAFNRSITACENFWGDHAFKRPESNGWRDQMIAGMYDAQMIAVSQLSDSNLSNLAKLKRKIISATTKAFLSDREFEDAIRHGTNTPSRVIYRIQKMKDVLLGLI